MVPGRREEKKRQTRAAIITAATQIFAAKGYLNTNIEAIAKDAGIAVGTVYNYFPSKEELLQSLIAEQLDHVWSAVAQGQASRAPRSAETVVALFHRTLDEMNAFNRRLWREGFAVTLSESSEPDTMWAMLEDGILDRLDDLLADPSATASPQSETASELLAGVFLRYVLAYIGAETLDMAGLKANLREEVLLAFRGIG